MKNVIIKYYSWMIYGCRLTHSVSANTQQRKRRKTLFKIYSKLKVLRFTVFIGTAVLVEVCKKMCSFSANWGKYFDILRWFAFYDVENIHQSSRETFFDQNFSLRCCSFVQVIGCNYLSGNPKIQERKSEKQHIFSFCALPEFLISPR